MKTLTTARTNSTDEENHSLNEKEEKRKTYKLNIARFFRRFLRKPKDKSMFIAVDDRSIDGRGVEKELTSPPLILSCVITSLKDKNYSDNERMISVDSKQSRGDTTPSEAIVAFGDYGSMSSIGTTRDYMPDDNILGSYEYRSFYSRSSDGLTTVDFENDDTVGDNTYGMSSHEYSSSFLRSSFFRRRKERHVEERIFHINAPPGKLGISMDTPNDGAVVIQAIKVRCKCMLLFIFI